MRKSLLQGLIIFSAIIIIISTLLIGFTKIAKAETKTEKQIRIVQTEIKQKEITLNKIKEDKEYREDENNLLFMKEFIIEDNIIVGMVNPLERFTSISCKEIDIHMYETQISELESNIEAQNEELNKLRDKRKKEIEEQKKSNSELTGEAGSLIGTFRLTAYCGCSSCSEGYGNMTSTGVRAREGVTIAVDPRVIPYGSKVYIEGVGVRIAQDCGGAIKGNRIDVFVLNHGSCNSGKYNRTAKVWRVK